MRKKNMIQVIGFTRRTTSKDSWHYHDIGAFWNEFDTHLAEKLVKYASEKDCWFDVSTYPNNNDNSVYDYTIGVPYNGTKNEHSLSIIPIPAGSYAVFDIPAEYKNKVGDYVKLIFTEWLPASGYQLTGYGEIEYFTKTEAQIWMPIK